MNILAIGNSFSEDATRYLHGIARAGEVDLAVANLYIGGCSLERHYQNMLTGGRAYELQYNGQLTHFAVSLAEALDNRPWDVVTLQQASHFSFDAATYQPYVGRLAAYIRERVPSARLFLHQTWAYEEGSERLLRVAGYARAADMLADVTKAYAQIATQVDADGIIPSGELLGRLAAAGVGPLHRDTFHASLGLGRYAMGLLWYRVLCHKPVADNAFCDFDEPIDPQMIMTVKRCVETW
ncbi:MAG: DUF4886 domain-containing protein [Clostridia bacterium]|nr:DUF4886 domain-containing protein [Clostridia bacterium]